MWNELTKTAAFSALIAFLPVQGIAANIPESSISDEQKTKQSPSYCSLLDDICSKKEEFSKKYLESKTKSQKDKVIDESRSYLFDVITNDVFPSWYGTTWAFRGKTRTPNEGSIACGYFVSTVLEDVGLKVDRITLAEQCSEDMIMNLSANASIARFSNKPVSDFEDYVRSSGKGIYIVGLDIHTGFVVNDGRGGISFVHSSYYPMANSVVSEGINSKNPLSDSKYRVVGKIFDSEMVRKWLLEEPFGIKYDCDKRF